MAGLSATYHGYDHQDAVIAYALGLLLVPRSGFRAIAVERKSIANDCFDDLEISELIRHRVQIKSHTSSNRQLCLSDFTSHKMSFRIDGAVRSVAEDPNPAGAYKLVTTFLPSDDL